MRRESWGAKVLDAKLKSSGLVLTPAKRIHPTPVALAGQQSYISLCLSAALQDDCANPWKIYDPPAINLRVVTAVGLFLLELDLKNRP